MEKKPELEKQSLKGNYNIGIELVNLNPGLF